MSAMKYFLILSLAVLGQWAASADMGAIVKGDRVNVRKAPSITAEIVGQVEKDTLLIAVERHEITPSHKDEPVSWIKVRLTSTNAWIKSSYLDDKNQVQADQLNLREGPGTNHKKIGQINRGETVKRLETKGDWTRVSATGSYGFIAESFVTLTDKMPPVDAEVQTDTPAKPEQPQPEVKVETPVASTVQVTPAKAPPVVRVEPEPQALEEVAEPAEEVVVTAPKPVEIATPAPVKEPTPPAAVVPPIVAPVVPMPITPIEARQPEAKQPDSEPESIVTPLTTADSMERIVLREGVVRPTGSPAAPSPYGLYSIQNNRLINYLYVTNSDIVLKKYSGKKVHVRGPESIDSRWRNHPLLTVRTIELLNRR